MLGDPERWPSLLWPAVGLRAAIFDIGGVLEHTPATGWQQAWAERLGFATAAAFDERLGPIWSPGSTGHSRLDTIERQTAEALGLDYLQVSTLMDDAWTEYLGTLNVQMAEYFAGLRPRYRTGILSNSFVGAREREQAAYGFEDICDTVVYSHEEGLMKPEPSFYLLACERLRVAPAETLFLDDVPENVRAAEKLGMQGVLFVDTVEAIAAIDRLLAAGPLGQGLD